MLYIIFVIGFLSVVDLSATIQWITKDANLEGNPLMQSLWLFSPGLFVFAKLMMTAIFCYIAFKYRGNRLMRRLIWLPLFMYIIVAGMHVMILLH